MGTINTNLKTAVTGKIHGCAGGDGGGQRLRSELEQAVSEKDRLLREATEALTAREADLEAARRIWQQRNRGRTETDQKSGRKTRDAGRQ